MTRLQDALDRLAERLRVSPIAAAVRATSDLSGADAQGLVLPTDAAVGALDGISARADPALARAALREACGLPGDTPVTLAADRDAARAAAVRDAERRTGRTGAITATEPSDADLARHAAWIVEPLDDVALLAARRRATEHGCRLVVDEHRTFGRTAERLAHVEAAVTADACLLGESVAAGLPFGAVLGADVADAPPPTDLATTAATALVGLIAATATSSRLAARGQELRSQFESSRAREDIHARLVGPAACMRVEFEGQEMAEAPLMALHFGLELDRIGFRLHDGWILPHADLGDIELASWRDGLDRAIARMRCLLIEHNSYLCGGVRFPFPNGHPTVVDRGLALYRYPKLGPVELTSEPDCFRIRFLGGELGEVTSSGFYLPTLFTGDFDVRCGYRIHCWDPGPDSACLALFAQNLASSKRYYAQRMSGGDRPDEHTVLGSLATILSEMRPVSAPAGEFRIARRGSALTAYHKSPGETDWTELARDDAATLDDVVFGVKIWSKVESGPIEATIHDLALDARLATEQIPPLEHRQDPRGTQ